MSSKQLCISSTPNLCERRPELLRGCLIWTLVGFVVITSIAMFGFLAIVYALLALFVLFV